MTQKIRNRSIERIHCRSSSGVHLPGGRSWPALLRLRSQTALPKFRRSFSLGAAPSESEVRAWRKCSHKGRPDGNTHTDGQYLCYNTKPKPSAWGAASYALQHAIHTSCLTEPRPIQTRCREQHIQGRHGISDTCHAANSTQSCTLSPTLAPTPTAYTFFILPRAASFSDSASRVWLSKTWCENRAQILFRISQN